jgi:hypothetical protein
VQSLTISQNDTQTAALPHISTANIRDQTGTAITQDSQSTVNTRNVQVISLPGSTDIPRTDFSPSVNHQPTSVNPLVPLQTIGTTTYSPGTHVLDNLMSGTGMNPQNTCNYNANNSGRPLTLDIDSKTKAQIWANEFVSFDLLLPKKELKEIKYKFQDREGEGGPGFVKQQFMTSKVVNMAQWLEAFHVFVAIYCEKFPNESPSLMKYASIMSNVAKKSTETAALMYDHDFRKLRELDPVGIRWDRLCTDLFNEALGEGLKSKIREMEQLFLGKEKMPNKNNRKLTCHNYNNEGYCTRANGRFGHFCQFCGGSHPRKSCRKWLSQKQGHQNPLNAQGRTSQLTIPKPTNVKK